MSEHPEARLLLTKHDVTLNATGETSKATNISALATFYDEDLAETVWEQIAKRQTPLMAVLHSLSAHSTIVLHIYALTRLEKGLASEILKSVRVIKEEYLNA